MANVRRFCCDDETGEVITYSINLETGEPKYEGSPPVYVQAKTTAPLKGVSKTKYMKFPRGYMSKTKKFQSLKANILAGSNKVSHRMLVIPAMMIFPNLFGIILMISEIYLHVQCHKKNKKLKDPNLYYRSPLHIITSTFCGVCRENDSASKISQMQDQRRHRYDYFRVKNIPPVLKFFAKRGITPCRVSLDSGASGTKSVSSDTRHWSGKG